MRLLLSPAAALALLLVPLASPAQPLLHELHSPNEQPYGYFGRAVAGVPDVDGDGSWDLLVGTLGESPGTSPDSSGRAYLFSGASGALLLELRSPNEEFFGYFGSSVAGLPDLNGDGHGDLIVGAEYESPGTSPDYAGRAYVFSGASGELLFELASPSQQDRGRFGWSVAGVPDTDGDDRPDLLVGAPYEADDDGRAYLFSGSDGALLHIFASPNGGDHGFFGRAISGVSDVDGDGRGDVLIGAWYEDAFTMGPGWSGKAYVFSGASGALIHELVSGHVQIGGHFGSAVAGVPDVDGDGYDDLLVGAYGEEDAPNGNLLTGKAYVFSGASGSLLHALSSPKGKLDVWFAYELSGVPDVDGDGRGDLLISAHGEGPGPSPAHAGRAYVFSGANGALLHELASPNEEFDGNFGRAVAGIPDVDGDGRGDLLVGAFTESPGSSPVRAGRAYLFSGTRLLTLSAYALNSPISQGHRLRFEVVLTNHTPNPLFGDLDLTITGPDGAMYTTIIHDDGTLPALRTATPTYVLPIPGDAELGLYAATVTALEGGTTNLGEAAFTFEVVAGGARGDEAATLKGRLGGVEVLDDGGFREGINSAAQASATETMPGIAPNPASARTALSFALATPSSVRLVLHDVLGREVSSAETGLLAAGTHRLALEVASLPAGVYVWRLSANGCVESGRLTVAR